jgi:group I intron endonuclease
MSKLLSGSGVYSVTNTVTEDQYVGQASNFTKRWSKHRRMLQQGLHPNVHLQAAWNKHGEGAFAFRVLEWCDKCELTTTEQKWMDVLRPVYNKAPAAGSRIGTTQSPEARAKISAALKGVPKSLEHARAVGDAIRGQKRSSEKITAHNRAVAAARKGKKLPAEWAAKNAATCKKMGALLKGKPWSEARRAAHAAKQRSKSNGLEARS